ncbi:MAG: HYExAFE family protein [Gemmatales bacterium]|nr:HYExAFE family protein [Gemmatales bacterium]MDW7993242.1 HYExAFE family protein [Gemmatales bacterium]
MDGGNGYEKAFVAWLRHQGLMYFFIDETHRQHLTGQGVKSPDLVVRSFDGRDLVVDVKGRRYPGGNTHKPRRVWERWCTRSDCHSLLRWSEALHAQGVLVFVYHIRAPSDEVYPAWLEIWSWHKKIFGLCGVRVERYMEHMKLRSPKWDTVSLPMEAFRQLAEPVSLLFRVSDRHELVPLCCSDTVAE